MSVISRISNQSSGFTDFAGASTGYIVSAFFYLLGHYTSPVGAMLLLSIPVIFGGLLVRHEPVLAELLSSRFAKAFGFGCLVLVALMSMAR